MPVLQILLLIATFFLSVIYVFLIGYYRKLFIQSKPFLPTRRWLPPIEETIFFTILIPARNEEKNLSILLDSILKQDFPTKNWEIIVIDDFSTDKTADIVEVYHKKYPAIQLLSLAALYPPNQHNSYKKLAITAAVKKAKGTWIITTDADCIVPQKWLSTYYKFIQERQPNFVAAPVFMYADHRWIQHFQCLDFMVMQGITIASVLKGMHNMSNGANIAYRKKCFEQVDGFKGVDNLASGDDMFLMQKINADFPNTVAYLYNTDAIVHTAPMPTFKEFIHQRIRWASKATKLQKKDPTMFLVLLGIYLYNFCLFVLCIVGFFNWNLLIFAMLLILLKGGIETYFLKPVAHFFGYKKYKYLIFYEPLHIVYILLSGTLSWQKKYQWKQRKVH